jgi:hypothetical protein
MKKLSYLIVIILISSLVLTGCLLSNVGQVPSTEQSGISSIAKNGPSPCIDFESTSLGEGASIEGVGIVDPLLNINLEGKDLILIKKETINEEYLAYRANNPNQNDTRNGCLNGDYGFGCPVLANRIASGDEIVFTFQEGVTVSYFSVMMFDYGDWYPSGSGDPQIKLTDNNGHSEEYDFPSSTSTDYDACSGTGNGIKKLEISGSGIYEVTLKFVGKTDPGVGFDNVCFKTECKTDLIAGNPKNDRVDAGDVRVGYIPGNNYLTVTYNTEDGWLMNEIHFHVATDPADFPQKNGNPIPGQFDYKFEGLGGVDTHSFDILLSEIDGGITCGDLYFAAHAKLHKFTDLKWADTVYTSSQGKTKDLTDISDILIYPNSDPVNALGEADSKYDKYDTFFSLGVEGEIVLEFNNYIGGNITVYETTWHHDEGVPYPLEEAEVFTSKSGFEWEYLGTANNSGQSDFNLPIPNTFTLNGCVKYIKLVDYTDYSPHVGNANGFDLDAISAQLCEEESAWGEGSDFDGKNWAMYFVCSELLPVCE